MMLSKIFRIVNSRFANTFPNSSETSSCRFINNPWKTKGPILMGSSGSKMSFKAIKLVKYPTIKPPTGKEIQAPGKS